MKEKRKYLLPPGRSNIFYIQNFAQGFHVVFNSSAFVARQHSHYGFIHDVNPPLADGL